MPVRLVGPYDALKYRIDFGAMAGEVVKEKTKEAVTKAIGEKLGIGGANPMDRKPTSRIRRAMRSKACSGASAVHGLR